MKNPIKLFQKKNGLDPDGIVGKNTAKVIRDVYCDCNNEYASHFLGQLHHESGGFKRSVENLNYSYERLLEIFRYDVDQNKDRKISEEEKSFAKTIARNPEQITNFVYANQNGNGNMLSGDGWKFKGRGSIMLTGRANYEMFANKIGDMSIMENPDLVATKYFFEVACVYFNTRNIWKHCDIVDVKHITKVTELINGGHNGLSDRIKQTNRFHNLLKE